MHINPTLGDEPKNPSPFLISILPKTHSIRLICPTLGVIHSVEYPINVSSNVFFCLSSFCEKSLPAAARRSFYQQLSVFFSNISGTPTPLFVVGDAQSAFFIPHVLEFIRRHPRLLLHMAISASTVAVKQFQ